MDDKNDIRPCLLKHSAARQSLRSYLGVRVELALAEAYAFQLSEKAYAEQLWTKYPFIIYPAPLGLPGGPTLATWPLATRTPYRKRGGELDSNSGLSGSEQKL
ncbi:hypothetical protein QYF36_010886 [Acer negundo]|nr:hypothetical protein QYF36_010886 [Acer negundo]